jgi:para-aminobenzoate synthetase / 4-amino-4-deoxychorismate lyase
MPSPTAPDPARGLFETMLVSGGRPVRPAPHLDRLAGSSRAVFDQDLPTDLPDAIDAAARPLEMGRLRVDIAPAGDGLAFEIAAEPIDPAIFFPSREDGADLRTVRQPDWEGDEVLEAGRANIFLVTDGRLATPPVDGRILPGTARASTLELAADLGVPAAERRLHLEDLRGADDLFLTSSLRGIRPVRTLDGESLKGTDPLVERLAGELRRRWLDEGAGPR